MKQFFRLAAAAVLLGAATLAFAQPAGAATQWSAQDSGSNRSLHGVAFVSDTTGLAVGDAGTVLSTTDGGTTWEPLDAGTTEDLYAVQGMAELCGEGGTEDCWWVAGDSGTILFSADSGATWCAQETNTTARLESLGNVGPNDVLAVGTGGTFIRSGEGGTNGSECGADAAYTVGETGTTADLHAVIGAPGGGAWTAVGDGGTIVRATDFYEGAPVDSPTAADLFGLAGNCGDTVCREIAVGAAGTVVTSADGADFEAHSAGVDETLRSVALPLDDIAATAVGDVGTVVASDDGGETWGEQTTPTCADLQSVSQPVVFDDVTPTAPDAWAAGTKGTILMNAEDGDATAPTCTKGPGYRMVAADGGIFTFGERHFHGSTGDIVLNQPIVGGATRGSDFDGYWIVARDGGVFAFNASFHGSLANETLPAPAVEIEPTPSGAGYWIVLANGTVRAFGDAAHFGDMTGQVLNQPIIGMSVTITGEGYWLVAQDGGIFSFGDATFHGSMGGQQLNAPVIDLGPTTDGDGYYLLGSDGGVFSFGSAEFHGSTGAMQLNQPVVSMLVRSNGYWLGAADGGVFTFGDLQFLGSMGAVQLNAPVLDMID